MTRAGRLAGPGGESGAAAVVVLVFLPCLLAALALVVDAGALLVARAEMRAAADMGALAGVQDLDWERLARGEVVVREEAAAADAEAWIRANLCGRPFLEAGSARVTVTVRNTVPGAGAACPVTGRRLDWPTVCVLVEVEVRLPFFSSLGPFTIRVHADASVVGRP